PHMPTAQQDSSGVGMHPTFTAVRVLTGLGADSSIVLGSLFTLARPAFGSAVVAACAGRAIVQGTEVKLARRNVVPLAHAAPKQRIQRTIVVDFALTVPLSVAIVLFAQDFLQRFPRIDRKSTRLNSSHVKISYAVF